MSSYSELQAQIAELTKKAEAARSGELASAKAQIAEIMREYGLTIADLANAPKVKSTKTRATVAVKFQHPESGETWTGRGRAPRWLEGKDKEEFRIKE